MITIYDGATLEAAQSTPLNPTILEMVRRIVSHARTSGLWQLTCIVIVEETDSAQEFEAVLGFPPSTGPLGGEGGAAEPYWAWLEERGDWIELLIPAGNDGFAWYILMTRDWFEARIGSFDSPA